MTSASKLTAGSDQPQPTRGLTTRTTPEPRSRSSGGRMRPTYSVLRDRRGTDLSLETVADDLKACLQPRQSATCMNPDCNEECQWPEGRGRPPLFHHRLCHEKYHLIRRRLLAELVDIDNALEREPPPASDERVYLENQGARRRWLLLRYPDLTSGDRKEGTGSERAHGSLLDQAGSG